MTSAFGGGVARTGKAFRPTPTTTTSTVPVTNSGIDDDATPSRTIPRSAGRSRRLAAKRPAAMATGIVRKRANPASLADRTMAAASCGRTSWPLTYEVPKSSVTTPMIVSTYWTMIGRSVPSFWFRASTLSWGANGPRIVRPTSLGRTLAITNTIVTSSQMVTRERSRRRRMKRAIGYLNPRRRSATRDRWISPPVSGDPRSACLGGGREDHLAEAAGIERAVELLRIASEVIVEVRQADRRVLDEDRLDLVAGRLLRVDADRGLEALECSIEVRRTVLRRIPDALALECCVEIDVRRAAMAVVDDAELCRAGAGRIGRIGGAPLRAGEGVEALRRDVQIDAGRSGLALEQRREVGDLQELARVERRREIAHAGLCEERLGLVDVLRPLRDGRVEVGISLPDHMIVAELCLALEELLDKRRTIERQGERLADALVGELALVRAHPDLAMQGRRGHDGREVLVVEQGLARQDVELDDRVHLVALVGRDHRSGRAEEDELEPVERRLAAPPVLVPDERGAGVRIVLRQLPRACPGGNLVECRPGDVRLGSDQGLRVEDRDEIWEVAVRAEELEHDRVRVLGGSATRPEDALEAGVAGRDEALHRRHDVVGRERRAVMPLDVLAKVERPLGAIRVGRPLQGEPWTDVDEVVRGQRAQELEGLGGDAIAAEILHRDRVDLDRLLCRDPHHATGHA